MTIKLIKGPVTEIFGSTGYPSSLKYGSYLIYGI